MKNNKYSYLIDKTFNKARLNAGVQSPDKNKKPNLSLPARHNRSATHTARSGWQKNVIQSVKGGHKDVTSSRNKPQSPDYIKKTPFGRDDRRHSNSRVSQFNRSGRVKRMLTATKYSSNSAAAKAAILTRPKNKAAADSAIARKKKLLSKQYALSVMTGSSGDVGREIQMRKYGKPGFASELPEFYEKNSNDPVVIYARSFVLHALRSYSKFFPLNELIKPRAYRILSRFMRNSYIKPAGWRHNFFNEKYFRRRPFNFSLRGVRFATIKKQQNYLRWHEFLQQSSARRRLKFTTPSRSNFAAYNESSRAALKNKFKAKLRAKLKTYRTMRSDYPRLLKAFKKVRKNNRYMHDLAAIRALSLLYGISAAKLKQIYVSRLRKHFKHFLTSRLKNRNIRLKKKIFIKAFAYAKTIIFTRIMRAAARCEVFYRLPFVSASHLVWLQNVVKKMYSRYFKPHMGREFVANSSLASSMFFSKGLFFCEPDESQIWAHYEPDFVEWHSYFYRRFVLSLKMSAFKQRRQWNLYAVESNSDKGLFPIIRNAKQSSDYAVAMLDNRPFWLVNAARTGTGHFMNLKMWEYRIQQIVMRRFAVVIDPFLKESRSHFSPALNPLSPVDKLPNSSHVIGVAARYFLSAFVLLHRRTIDEEERRIAELGPTALATLKVRALDAPSYIFKSALRNFIKTSAREHRSVLADFSNVWAGLGSIRKFYRGEASRKVPRAGLYSPSFHYPYKKSLPYYYRTRGGDFLTWFERRWVFKSLTTSPKMFGASARELSDGRSPRMSEGNLSVPRRFVFLADLQKSNFTSYFACNPASFLKMLIDCANLMNVSPSAPRAANETFRKILSRVVSLVNVRLALANSHSSNPKIKQPAGLRKLGLQAKFLTLGHKYGLLRTRWGPRGANIIFMAAAALWNAKRKISRARRALWDGGANYSVGRVANLARAGAHKNSFVFSLNYVAYIYMRTMQKRVKTSAKEAGIAPDFFYIDGDFLTEHNIFIPYTSLMREVNNRKMLRAFKMEIFRGQRLLSKTKSGGLLDNYSRSSRDNPISLTRKSFVFLNKKPSNRQYLYQDYMFHYVLARHVADLLEVCTALKRGNDALSNRFGRSAELAEYFKKVTRVKTRKLMLLKIKPDTKGRSRIFYFLQKKAWRWRKFNKNYRLVSFFQPMYNLNTRRYGQHSVNKHIKRMRINRGKWRNSFRLKMVVRHIFRKKWFYSTNRLKAIWKRMRETKLKWLTYYKLHEGMLANYLSLVGLVPKKWSASMIRSGLIFVNGVVCFNPKYYVRPRDVIVLNNEAYWTMLGRRIAKLSNKLFPRSLPGATVKRKMLKTALARIRKSFAAGDVTAAIHAREKKALIQADRLFSVEPDLARLPKKPLAPGGPRRSKEDIYNSNLSHFTIRDNRHTYTHNRERFNRRLNILLKRLDRSRYFDGRFFFRHHNAVMVIRAPGSAEELFSVSGRRKRGVYTPKAIRYMLSHRFWH